MSKLSYFFTVLLVFPFCASAQEHTSLPDIRSMAYIGNGFVVPSSAMKRGALVDNGVNFRFGFFQSLKKGNHPVSGFSWQPGLEIRVDYSKFPASILPPASVRSIKYSDGTSAPITVLLKQEPRKKKPDAFQYLAGPSVLLSMDRFFLQPSVLIGYASVAQEPFRFYDSIRSGSNPSQDQVMNFYTSTHETNNGLVVSAAVKAGYRVGRYLSLFASVDYSLGSGQKFTDQVLVPAGNPDASGVYGIQQLKNGTLQSTGRQSRFRALILGINLAFTLPYK